jgi:hypothetical protein
LPEFVHCLLNWEHSPSSTVVRHHVKSVGRTNQPNA